MLAIFKRDFKSYLHSFIGPLAVTVILIFMMIFFAVNNMVYGYSVINAALYGACLYGITFSMPILCMRTFAEERRSKTDQMILTAPVSIAGIVIGKFMALFAVLLIPAGLSCFLPLVLGKYGDVPYKWSYTCVLAFVLYGMMIISLCMFMSSLVENPIIAAVFSLIVSFLGILLPGAYSHIPIEWLRKFLDSTYNFTDRLADLMMGTLDWTAVIYFVSLTLLFLFLCTQVIEKRRYSLKKGMYSAGIYSGSLIIICIAAVIAINVSSVEFPETIKNIDVSGTGMYSLTKDSKDILNNMTDDVAIYYLAKENDTEGEKDVDVERILKLYAGTGKHVTFSYVDPTISPDFAKQYTDNELSYNSVIVVDKTNGRSKAVDYYDMALMEYDSNYQPYISGYDTEGQVTGAIQYVMLSSDQLLNAYCIIGHDELGFDQSYDRVFTNYSMNLHDIDLKTVSEIPADCDLLIINAPESDYLAEEVSLIKDYLDKGGDIMIMTFYAAPNMNNFSELLSYYGVEKKPGLVVEADESMYFYQLQVPVYLYPELCYDAVTENVADGAGEHVMSPFSQALVYTDDPADSISYSPLLRTSETAYIKTDYQNAENLDKAAGDEEGQFVVALRAQKVNEDGSVSKAAIYTGVFMDPYAIYGMFSEATDYYTGGMNQKLFGNTLGQLVELENDIVTIPSHDSVPMIYLTPVQARNILLTQVIVIAVIFFGGLGIWIYRRRG